MSCLLSLMAQPLLQAGAREDTGKSDQSYAVVQVGADVQIVPSESVKEMKKSAQQADKEALASWTERKKAAAKAKTPFSEPKPAKTPFKVHAPKLKSMEKASAVKAKALEKIAAAKDSKDKKGLKRPSGSSKRNKEKKPKDGDGSSG